MLPVTSPAHKVFVSIAFIKRLEAREGVEPILPVRPTLDGRNGLEDRCRERGPQRFGSRRGT